jgi:hypothetical protein
MGKKGREKRRKREFRQRSRAGLTFTTSVARINSEEDFERWANEAPQYAAAFERTLNHLQSEISSFNPLSMLTDLAVFGLAQTVDQQGSVVTTQLDALPAHVELIQALYLRTQFAQLPAKVPTAVDVHQVHGMAARLSEQFNRKRLGQVPRFASQSERNRLSVIESVRINTQFFRGWATEERAKRLMQDVAAHLDGRVEKELGFSLTDAINVFDWLRQKSGQTITLHDARINRIRRGTANRECVEIFLREFPGVTEGDADDFRRRGASNMPIERLKSEIASLASTFLVSSFCFSAEHVAVSAAIAVDRAHVLLNYFSYKLGDLSSTETEHLFLHNPIWERPIIQLRGGTFFCPMPHIFFARAFDSLFRVMNSSAGLRATYEKFRANYLEKELQRIFLRAFPDATLYPSLRWYSGTESSEFENDLVVWIEPFLLIVECKSGRISPSARRGGEKRLADDINELIEEPSRQSLRLAEEVTTARGEWRSKSGLAAQWPFRPKDVFRVARLSVTLEDVSFVRANCLALKSAGFIPNDLDIAPTISLPDLEVVVDLLVDQPRCLHYLLRRGELEGRANYVAREFDFLGAYLQSGLSIGDHEFNRAPLIFNGLSAEIEAYLFSKQLGQQRTAPRHHVTRWWNALLQAFATKELKRWIVGSVALLCAGYQQQVTLEAEYRKLISDVKNSKDQSIGNKMLTFMPAMHRREAIVFLALRNPEISRAQDWCQSAASQMFGEHPTLQECFVVGIDVDQPAHPFNFSAALFRSWQP